MTPTDALIEKMARAIMREDGWFAAGNRLIPTAEAVDAYRRKARAAYEAEHEDEDEEDEEDEEDRSLMESARSAGDIP